MSLWKIIIFCILKTNSNIMEANKISGLDFLDILFEGRNKNYGAYELRKSYSKRLQISLLATLGFTALIFLLILIFNTVSNGNTGKTKSTDVTLTEIKQEEQKKVEPPPPPPPPKQEPPKIEMQKFTPPKIVEDEKFEEKNEVKEQEEITNISTVSQEGVKDEEFVAPPKVEEANTVVEPVKEEPGFLDPSMEAQFNGDWRSYVQRTIERSIDELMDDGQAGTCEVLFVVSEDGSVSNVEAITMKGTVLARISVDAIKRGPKWKPGKNALGQPVASKRIQKVTFVMPDE
jgi:protein TonB